MPALFDRFSALPGLVITSSICYTLLGLQVNNYRGSEGLWIWIRDHRTAVTVLVQLFAQVLGIIHVYVVCALIRSSFLVAIASKPFRVSTAHFVQTLTTPRWTWGLSWGFQIPLLLILAASFIPAPLWAAAIAPRPAEKNITSIINIPTFNISNATALWEADPDVPLFRSKNSGQWVVEQGVFSYTSQIFRGALLPSAREASLVVNGTRKHVKLDKTGYSYLNRSYGMGSIAGFPQMSNVALPVWYQYNETGIQPSVFCFYNRSMDYSFFRTNKEDAPIGLWQSHGILANGITGGFIHYATWTEPDLFGWSDVYNNATRKCQLQLFTGATPNLDPFSFAPLQDIQCDISFPLRTSIVTVNTSSKLVSLQSSRDLETPWPSYGDILLKEVASDLGRLTFSDSCQASGCTLGTSLVFNIETLRRQNRENSEITTLRGTEEFVASLVDNILINRLLTRYVSGAPGSSYKVPAIIGAPSIIFGDRRFIIIVGVLNLVIVLAYLVEFVRTLAWKSTPPFDIMNDSEVMVAAFEGGRSYERSLRHTSMQGAYQGRMSEQALLSLQYDVAQSGKPILLPHSTDLEYAPVPLGEFSTSSTSTHYFEQTPLVERQYV